MSLPKKWVSAKLSRSTSNSSPNNGGSDNSSHHHPARIRQLTPPSPPRRSNSRSLYNSLYNTSAASASSLNDEDDRGGNGNGQIVEAPPSPGPKKSWEWHYKSFLTRSRNKDGGSAQQEEDSQHQHHCSGGGMSAPPALPFGGGVEGGDPGDALNISRRVQSGGDIGGRVASGRSLDHRATAGGERRVVSTSNSTVLGGRGGVSMANSEFRRSLQSRHHHHQGDIRFVGAVSSSSERSLGSNSNDTAIRGGNLFKSVFSSSKLGSSFSTSPSSPLNAPRKSKSTNSLDSSMKWGVDKRLSSQQQQQRVLVQHRNSGRSGSSSTPNSPVRHGVGGGLEPGEGGKVKTTMATRKDNGGSGVVRKQQQQQQQQIQQLRHATEPHRITQPKPQDLGSVSAAVASAGIQIQQQRPQRRHDQWSSSPRSPTKKGFVEGEGEKVTADIGGGTGAGGGGGGNASKEMKVAFTEFHNSSKFAKDSTSPYLGDETSVHQNAVFAAYGGGNHGGVGEGGADNIGGSVGDGSGAALMSQGAITGTVAGKFKQPSPRLQQQLSSSEPTKLAPVSEENKPIQGGDPCRPLRASRVLNPLAGPESWTKGRRYFIAPAVMSMCPVQALSVLSGGAGGIQKEKHDGGGIGQGQHDNGEGSGSCTPVPGRTMDAQQTADESIDNTTSSDSTAPFPPLHRQDHSPFGKVVLGKATVAKLGPCELSDENYGWSFGLFVLRQNYLLEYEEDDNVDAWTRPRGYAHLQHSVVHPHSDFGNALQLEFYESPSSRGLGRMLMMRVESQKERDRWVRALIKAAQLTIEDLYEFDKSLEFGKGRYATIHPARRRKRINNGAGAGAGAGAGGDEAGMATTAVTLRSYSWHSTGSIRSREDGDESQSSNRGSDQKQPSQHHSSLRGLAGVIGNGVGSSSSAQRHGRSNANYDCALKIVDKNEFWSRVKKARERADTLVRETAVQATLTSQASNDVLSFLRLRSFFETCENVVMELELLEGTDLFRHISSKGVLNENEAAHVMGDVLRSLHIMKHIGIAHRDVKPANILMCNKERDGVSVKLGDFGMATFVGVDDLVRGRCGTPGYVAPEIFKAGVNGGYRNTIDVFSAGVTLYVMLCGYEPFYGESDAELIAANKEAYVEFPETDWHEISAEGKDLVKRMMEPDPNKRIGVAEALNHPWITNRTAAHALPLWKSGFHRESAVNDVSVGEAACSVS